MKQNLKDKSVNQVDQFTNIARYFRPKQGVDLKDKDGLSIPLSKDPLPKSQSLVQRENKSRYGNKAS